ncbi:MAG: DNA translocase FtsK 4TM domain-containing protein [Candidatus Kapaibacteriota bacterium]
MGKDKNIEIRYKKVQREEPPLVKSTHDSKEELRRQIISNYQKWIRILSIIIALICIFTIISILSFSPTDEFISELRITDYFKAIWGDETIVSKIKQVSNLMGPFGAAISSVLINRTIGYFSIVFPILLFLWAIKLLITQSFSGRLVNWTVVSLLLAFCLSAFVGSVNILFGIAIPYYWAGSVGVFLSTVSSNFFGKFGSFALYLAALFLIIIFSFDIRIEKIIIDSLEKIKVLFKKEKSNSTGVSEEKSSENLAESQLQEEQNEQVGDFAVEDKETAHILIRTYENPVVEENEVSMVNLNTNGDKTFAEQADLEVDSKDGSEDLKQGGNQNVTKDKKLVVIVEETEEVGRNEVEEKSQSFSPISTLTLDEKINYNPPPLDLLIDDESKFQINEEELKQNAKLLQEKLETFKIYIENLTVTPGPVVTQYEFVPAPGIKISRIQSLSDDIALGLKAKGIRIIAPVPGKGTVGIEIPNKKPLVVRFGNCLKNAKINPNFHLPIIFGKTISGEVFVDDLARMPHLLIAGATGSGKSVGINTIIASLIYRMHPQNLKFVIIDPKKVELTHYQQLLYHFLAVSPEIEDAIVTEPSDAVLVLKALIAEMQSRYDILASVQQKNIFEYNKKVREGLFRNEQEFVHRPMPYIVTIIDELADLMLTTGKEIEGLIIRLAQLARAVGIHLVVATQRPSVDIITGLIKANFPARIAYLVASRVDSRTILDTIGAEQLLGNGDMLFLPSGWPNPIRIQNAFLTTEEIELICNHIGNQKGYSKPYYLPRVEDGKSDKETFDREGFDPLFEEAARLIIRHQQASVSMLQRRLKIGYNRAGRIMDELEMAGIVGPFDGSKGRTIKIATEDELDRFLNERGL